jgi:hypothetical protein
MMNLWLAQLSHKGDHTSGLDLSFGYSYETAGLTLLQCISN